MNVAYNMDCLPAMKETPDNFYDLAVVDPPYGDGLTDKRVCDHLHSSCRKLNVSVENRGG